MIKAEVNRNRVKAEASGQVSDIMTELHNLIESMLSDLEKIGNGIITKQHLLTMLYQNILKEWSAENENE